MKIWLSLLPWLYLGLLSPSSCVWKSDTLAEKEKDTSSCRGRSRATTVHMLNMNAERVMRQLCSEENVKQKEEPENRLNQLRSAWLEPLSSEKHACNQLSVANKQLDCLLQLHSHFSTVLTLLLWIPSSVSLFFAHHYIRWLAWNSCQ